MASLPLLYFSVTPPTPLGSLLGKDDTSQPPLHPLPLTHHSQNVIQDGLGAAVIIAM
jgi:hypothetical protein